VMNEWRDLWCRFQMDHLSACQSPL
jgi:hypothetical protein